MTLSAWIMLAVTWTVIVFFTSRFFWRVLTLPLKSQDADESTPQSPRDSSSPHRS